MHQSGVLPATHIDVQPAALLARVPASTTSEALNTALRAHGLTLPIVPLEHGLTMRDLLRRNAGGRRQLTHGTLAHYLRAATLRSEGTDEPLRLGGPTLKRATGYNLQRALLGGSADGLPPLDSLRDLTVNLRPLPAARHELLFAARDTAAACTLAAALLASGVPLSALALLDAQAAALLPPLPDSSPLPALPADHTLLLAELEGLPAVLHRQAAQLAELAAQVEQSAPACRLLAAQQYSPHEPHEPARSCWHLWEQLQPRWQQGAHPPLACTLPRAELPHVAQRAAAVAQRYGLTLALWSDAGVGRLHLRLAAGQHPTPLHAAELAQAATVIAHLWQPHGAPTSDQPQPPVPPALPSVRMPAVSTQPLIPRLRQALGAAHVLTHPDQLLTYTRDASIAQATGRPQAVVFPGSTQDVSAVLRLAAEAGVPVVTRGAGSGLAGGSTPSPDALLLVLTRMQQLAIDAPQRVARVGAGVVTGDLQRAAAAHGLSYVPDPSSQGVSTLGGNLACNAGGPRCLKYGVTASYVLGLTAVLADGTPLHVGDGLSAQTPDAGLLHLLLGSEGTLAVISAATLRLLPPPPARRTTLAIFDSLDAACATVEAIMAAGLLPASLELLDATSLRVVEAAMGLGLPRDAGALLLLLADGEPETVDWEAEQLATLARQGGARQVQVAQQASDEAAFWQARRAVSPAFARVQPNKLGEDICVPLPRIAATVRAINAIAARYDLTIPVFGHAGDGNLHPNILFDARDPQQVERVWQAAAAIFALALEQGGTLSGEHGIGTLKRPFLAAALGPAALALHQALKARFDPAGRLNPGKLL
jgi:glycolate oxidase subunit GlcD